MTVLSVLIATNFMLGVYDSYITQRRITDFGVGFELNRFIKYVSTRMGPQVAVILGIMGPNIGWAVVFWFFHLPVLLALLVGYNLKRFEVQVTSAVFEKNARKIQKMINEYGSGSATLPDDSQKSKPDPSPSDKVDIWKYSERK